jgi:NADPH:quinone reductase
VLIATEAIGVDTSWVGRRVWAFTGLAHFALSHPRFAPGESVLVRGAAGSIGIMTVQLAARGGASAVAVTTSSAERGDRLRKLGATHVLNRAGEGGQDAPPGYDVIIDIVAGRSTSIVPYPPGCTMERVGVLNVSARQPSCKYFPW